MNTSNGSHSLAAKYTKVPNTLDTRGEDYKLPNFTDTDQTALAGKRVLMISADGPELPEIDVPREYLKARGADVKLAGQNWIFEIEKRNPPGCIVIAQWLADNICVKVDLALRDVRVAEWDDKAKNFKTNYDAIFIPGGAWNPDMLRTDGDALRIVREARAHGVLIVSLCHGPQVLISAARSDPSGQVVFPRGTHITGVESIRADLDNAGFTVHDKEPTVYDPLSRLLTARAPKDLGPLCEEMGRLLSQPAQAGRPTLKNALTGARRANYLTDKYWGNMMFNVTFKQVQWVTISLGILLIEAALLYKLITDQATSQTEVIIAICILGIFFVLSSNVDNLRIFSIGKEGFRAELEVLQEKTSENDQAITDLILLSMGRDAYKNLQKLATGNFGQYNKVHHMGLETELYHLRNLGYIDLKKDIGFKSIYDLPEDDKQLSDYIEVTERGEKYLKLREKYALKE